MTGKYTLHLGDCLDVMAQMPDESVDAVITDPPYGTTACKWDGVIPFEPMWAQLKRIVKPRAAIVLFGSQPFTSALVMSNPDWFKCEWVWDKNRGNGHLVANYRPLQRTESIVVFSDGRSNYNPQMVPRNKPRKFGGTPSQTEVLTKQAYRKDYSRSDYTHRYPTNLLAFSWSNRNGLHPTQKPVDLIEYLIRTYTNAGATVLDFTMGSGTTGVACMTTGRKFVGIELDADYFAIAQDRIEKATWQLSMFDMMAADD